MMDYKKAAVELWHMLDDIDTYSDIVKDNDKVFREVVEKKVRQRFNVFESDGYCLYTPVSEGRDKIT